MPVYHSDEDNITSGANSNNNRGDNGQNANDQNVNVTDDGPAARETSPRESLSSLTRRQSLMEKETKKKINQIRNDHKLILDMLQRLMQPEEPDLVNESEGGGNSNGNAWNPASPNEDSDANRHQVVNYQTSQSGGISSGDFKPSSTDNARKPATNASLVAPAAMAPNHRPATQTQPRRRLETLNFHPEENLPRFRQWVKRITQFQVHYQLSYADAIAELHRAPIARAI